MDSVGSLAATLTPVSGAQLGSDQGPKASQPIFSDWLDRPEFFSRVIGAMASNLEHVLGYEDAASLVTLAGGRLAEDLSTAYTDLIAQAPSVPEGVAAALIDLKARIGGRFSVESITGKRIVLVNSECPFAGQVQGRPSLCMMTTNVFGRIAADASGNARVEIEEALALGDRRCRVVVDLSPESGGDGYRFTR